MRIYGLFTATVLAGSIAMFGASRTLALQKGGNQNRGGGGGGGQSRPAPAPPREQSRPAPAPPRVQSRPAPAPPVHAQREIVRTPNFVPRTTGGAAPRPAPPAENTNPGRTNTFQPSHVTTRRPIVATAPTIQNARKFTKTATGRVYDNGLSLRKGMTVTATWQKHYFPKGHYHFPYYRQTFERGQSFRSPFGFFFGVCVPYIGSADCRVFPPSVVFIDVPVYNDVQCTGFEDAGDQNLFNDPTLNDEQPGLLNAIDDLTEAFQGGNIDGLVTLIDPNTSIAIYLSGHYQYSLPANDYIDLARDAIQSMHTVQFSLTYLHQRAPGVFSIAGKQTYTDQNGQVQATWVSFVLQDISGQWTLTQVGTSPGRKQNG